MAPVRRVPAVAASVLACTLGLAAPAHSSAKVRLTVAPLPTIKDPSPGTPVVTWSTGTESPGQVTVATDGGDDTVFAMGPAGTQEAPWIKAGEVYEFKLYSTGAARRVLARLKFAPRAPPPPAAAPPTVGVPVPKHPPDTAEAVDRLLQVLPFAGLMAFGVLGTLLLREARRDA